jgi:flagellar FliL protein
MSEAKDDAGSEPARKGKGKLLLIACIVALVAGGGGFYTVYFGLLPLSFLGDYLPFLDDTQAGHGDGGRDSQHADAGGDFEPGAYVDLDPLVISLGPQSRSRHLKVSLVVEVAPGREDDVKAVRPRIVDVLQGLLRAVDEHEFELPRSMERLRAQMLRRVELVAPGGSVRDLLVQEFLLD